MVCTFVDAHFCQQVVRQFAGINTVHSQHRHRSQHDVFRCGQVREQLVVLEHHANALTQFVRRHIAPADVLAGEEYIAAVGGREHVDAA